MHREDGAAFGDACGRWPDPADSRRARPRQGEPHTHTTGRDRWAWFSGRAGGHASTVTGHGMAAPGAVSAV